MEKWMIVYVLPLEVWMDIFVFPWISRKEFGQLISKIGNFKFAEHAQFYLHEWGKRSLGKLYFDKDGICKYINNMNSYRLEYPQTPMPENIKSFGHMWISHFDANALDFLAKIRPLLTGEVKITLDCIPDNRLENMHTILTNLAPMLGRIQSVYCANESTLSVVNQCLDIKAKSNVFTISTVNEMSQGNVNIITDWLTHPDNGPRLCELLLYADEGLFEQISQAVRQQFHAATTPSTFAVHLASYVRKEVQFAEFHRENGIGEELHGIWDEDERVIRITRHPANCKTETVREWIKGMTERRIAGQVFIFSPTIGLLDAAPQIDMPSVDAEQDVNQQQKPCSSNDA